jgi:hypothetical protein
MLEIWVSCCLILREISRSRAWDVHKGMRKSHFTTVHDAIPYSFYQCKDVVVLWVEDDPIERCFQRM